MWKPGVHDDDAHLPFCDACLQDVDGRSCLVFLEPELRQDGVQLGMPEISCTRMSVESSEELGHRALELHPAGLSPGPRELDVGVHAIRGIHQRLDVSANAIGLEGLRAGRDSAAGESDPRRRHSARH